MTRLLLILSTLLISSISRADMDLSEIQSLLDSSSSAGVMAKDYCNQPDQRNQWPCDEALRLERENKRLVASIKSRGGK